MSCALMASERSVGPCMDWADVLVGTDAMTQTSNLHLGAFVEGGDLLKSITQFEIDLVRDS